MGAARRLGQAGIGQRKGHRLGCHDRAATGMDRHLIWNDALLGEGLGNELASQCGSFRMRQHPAGDVAAEYIQDDVDIKAGSSGETVGGSWPAELSTLEAVEFTTGGLQGALPFL